jgi:hypothetical protein
MENKYSTSEIRIRCVCFIRSTSPKLNDQVLVEISNTSAELINEPEKWGAQV